MQLSRHCSSESVLCALAFLVSACASNRSAAEGHGGSSADGGPLSVDAGAGELACGYHGGGHVLRIGSGLELCLPPVVCTPSETCPRGLGDCVAGQCVFRAAYRGLATLGEAWATYYCDLESGGCDGSVQNPRPLELAKAIAVTRGPLCRDAPSAVSCVGIAAAPPMMVGNSQIAREPATGGYISLWGLGMTAASGVCYRITGSAGSAVVGLTERCAGYCKCGAQPSYGECSACLNAPDTTTECACVGSAPPLYSGCCGSGCSSPGQCDWCASNNHAHFDLDNATFQHVCGASGQHAGSCQLSQVEIVRDCYAARADWPN